MHNSQMCLRCGSRFCKCCYCFIFLCVALIITVGIATLFFLPKNPAIEFLSISPSPLSTPNNFSLPISALLSYKNLNQYKVYLFKTNIRVFI